MNYEDLVTNNTKLVYLVLKKMNLYSRKDEYFDIGMIGLVKAAKKFDLSKGYTFTTYACNAIYKTLLQEIRKEKSNKMKINFNTISLNAVINNGDITLEELIADSINIEHQIEKQELIKKLYKAISMLNLREQEILYALYGLNNQKCLTQRQLKERYSFNSQSSISAIKRRCISKLKKIMDGECL